MDPITAAILAALATGAAAGLTEVSKTALTDAYGGLKALLARKFGARRMRLARALQPAGLLLTSSLLVALLVDALAPAFLAVVLGDIVSRVEETTSDVLSVVLLPLAFFTGVLILSQLAETIIQPVEYLIVNRIDGAHRARLSQMIAAVSTIEILELSDVQVMIREVDGTAPRVLLGRGPWRNCAGSSG